MRILDLLYLIYNSLIYSNSLFDRIKVKGLLRNLIVLLCNIIVPLYFKLTKNNKENSIYFGSNVNVIISFTSFPARISNLWIVVECILRQTKKPKEIVLWLSRNQFRGLDDLPSSLIDQTRRGLTIRFVDGDIRSYKKYYYAFIEYPNIPIITIDDDIFYRKNLVEELYLTWQKNKNSVICKFPCLVRSNSAGNGIEFAEKKWLKYDSGNHIFFGTGGGTIYLPSTFNSDIINKDLFLKLCPTADDVFVNALTRISNLNIVCINPMSLLSIVNIRDEKLVSQNGELYDLKSCNGKQISNIIEYYKCKIGINPFEL